MSKFKLWSARPTEGGMNLIRALGGKRIRINRRKPYLARRGRVVINWGSVQEFNVAQGQGTILNGPWDLQPIVDKKQFFIHMDEMEVSQFCVPYTLDKKAAEKWIAEKAMVVARTVLNGHSGAGIVIAGGKNELPDAPLYTKYIKKDEEWRIHMVKTDDMPDTIYVQKKVKRKDYEGKHNRYVRNHDNGYTYQHNGVEAPAAVIKAASYVFKASGLDFGAVDVIYRKPEPAHFDDKDGCAWVLEINSAPGLEGRSVEVYAEAFKKYWG